MTELELQGLRRFRQELLLHRERLTRKSRSKLEDVVIKVNAANGQLDKGYPTETYGLCGHVADAVQISGNLEMLATIMRLFDDYAHDYFPDINSVKET